MEKVIPFDEKQALELIRRPKNYTDIPNANILRNSLKQYYEVQTGTKYKEISVVVALKNISRN